MDPALASRVGGRPDVHLGEEDGKPGPKGCEELGGAAQAGRLEADVDGDRLHKVELVGTLDLGEQSWRCQ